VLREIFSKETDASLEVSNAVLEIRRVRRRGGNEVLPDATSGERYEVRHVEGDNAHFIVGPKGHTTGLDLVYDGAHCLLQEPCIFAPVT